MNLALEKIREIRKGKWKNQGRNGTGGQAGKQKTILYGLSARNAAKRDSLLPRQKGWSIMYVPLAGRKMKNLFR